MLVSALVEVSMWRNNSCCC